MARREATNDEQNWLAKLTNTLDQNIKGVQFGLYGVGFVGLCIALRSVRPFQKFSRPSSIPASFVARQVPLQGVVRGADLGPDSAVLQVAHTPLVALGRSGKPPCLPVALSGVSPTVHGLSWLQITLDRQPVTFTVLATNQDVAVARVLHQGRDVSARLVELGFARVVPFDSGLERSEAYKKFYSALLRSERRAERNGNGMWWGSTPLHVRLANRVCSRLRLLAARLLPRRPAALVPVR